MALEQLETDLRLEPGDRLREGRLRQLEAMGRPRHLTLLRNRDEIAQLSEVEFVHPARSAIRAGYTRPV